MKSTVAPTLLIFAAFLLAFGHAEAPTFHEGAARAASAPSKVFENKRVTDREPNREGDVLVLMYHRTGKDESSMVRSYDNFKKDLLRLWKMGFRPVTLEEYVTNTMPLDHGASPVVFTFDDSHPSQLTLLKDGSIDPNCFVGMWKAFADEHPDFPVKATFFILPNGPFGQRSLHEKKMAILRDYGCEIGSHTMTHTALNKLDDDQVKHELADSYTFINKLGFTARSFATPYGVAPVHRSLLESFELNGVKYGYDNICLAGAGPAPSPLSKDFDRARIPRIKAYPGELGVTYWLNRVSNDKLDVYVQP